MSQNFTLKHFPPQFQGLSANCNEIIQDRKGYLWVTTDDGLCRFDGEEFKLYTTDEGLKRHEVNSITEGSDDEIWVSTRGGVSVFKDYKLFNDILESFPMIKNVSFDKIYYDIYSDVFYLRQRKEFQNNLFKYDKSKKSIFKITDDCVLKKVKIDSTFYVIVSSLDSESLIAVNNEDTTSIISVTRNINEVFKYENSIYVLIEGELSKIYNNKIINNSESFFNGFPNVIQSIKVVGEDLYFISNNNLYFYDGLVVTKVLKGDDYSRLKSLFVDRENNLWLCTDNGILKINATPFNGYNSKNNLFGVPTKIHRDGQGKLWVSTLQGLFYKWDSSLVFHKVLDGIFNDFIVINNDSIIFSCKTNKNPRGYIGIYNQKFKSSEILVIKSEIIDKNSLNFLNDEISSSVFTFTKDLENNVYITGIRNDLILKMDKKLNLLTFFDDKSLGKEGWIPSLFCHSNGDLWFRASSGLKRIRNSKVEKFKLDKNGFYSFIEDTKGNLIAVSDVGLTYIYLENGDLKSFKHFNKKNGLSENTIFTFSYFNEKDLLLGTSRGMNKIIDFSDSLSSTKFNVKFYDKKNGLIGVDFYVNATFLDADSSVWMGTSEGLMHYLPKKDNSNTAPPNLFLEEIKFQNTSQNSWKLINGDFEDIKVVKDPFFYHYQNDLTFDVKAISTSDPKMLKYSYFLEGAESKWNEPTSSSFSRYNNLSPGKYTFKCKAIRMSDGVESNVFTYSFKIDSPFYYKSWFYILIIFTLGFLIYLFVFMREKQLKLINESLERRVDLRTKQLAKEKKTVEKQNDLITKSISYAKRIQYSILPRDEFMNSFFSDHFIYYKPKDIVGGDFYWFRSFDDLAVIAAVDCTGHGVPGGFMSMMGSLLLDKIVQINNLDTSKVLSDLNSEIIRVLRQESEGSMQDGMDLSICLIDKKKNEIHFSGARNGIFVYDNKLIKHYEADLIPVGGFHSKKSKKINRKYSQQKISISQDSWVFMYTDGYVDQLGGYKMRSMGMELFQDAIKESVVLEDKNKRAEAFQNKYDEWRGEVPPIDDVLVIGFKI